MAKKRIRGYFSGRVQGVGFRFTAERIASDFSIGGFVRNLPDGRVEVLAEGEEESIKSFFETIKDKMGGYISSLTVQDGDYSGEFSDFEIRF